MPFLMEKKAAENLFCESLKSASSCQRRSLAYVVFPRKQKRVETGLFLKKEISAVLQIMQNRAGDPAR